MSNGFVAEDIRYFADVLWWIADTKDQLGVQNERSLSELQTALMQAETLLREVAAEMPMTQERSQDLAVKKCIGSA